MSKIPQIPCINNFRSGLFSHLPALDAKNQGYHQPIDTKFCMNHYNQKNMSDANFESGNFVSFRDIMSQSFPLKKGTSHQVRIFIPGK